MMAPKGSVNCRGISLFWKDEEGDILCLENQKVVDTNVIKFEFVTGKLHHGDKERSFVIGCYTLQWDTTGTTQHIVKHTIQMMPKGAMRLTIGNLNTNLEVPRDVEEEQLALVVDTWGLRCITKSFMI